MIRKITIVICILISSLNLSLAQRTVTELSNNWKFMRGNSLSVLDNNFDDSSWQNISIPHDWAIEQDFVMDGDGNTGKLEWKGEGWYRKVVSIPEDYIGKNIYLLFDGIMAFPSIYLNGEFVGRWDYGYNSFYLDITKYVKIGKENTLAIHVDTREHDSRWYPGAGIYRKIQMIAVNPIHVDIWGTFITTSDITKKSAKVNIETTIKNTKNNNHEIKVLYSILSSNNNIIVSEELKTQLFADSSITVNANIPITIPMLWDINNPSLYTLQTQIFIGNKLIDSDTSSFGIRYFKFTADDGFHLNGKRVQFKGVNLHHDHGPLGATFNKRAMQRQLEIMKEMGCNAIRTSHNVAAPELLELCDEMGLLFFNEIFDKYDAKADIVDSTNFENFAERNIRNFVLRDRNHPSVFIWSVGNEIGDVQWNIDSGFYKLKTMINLVRKYDTTRPVTLVCDSKESAVKRHFDYYDVHSWNYGRRYSLAREMEPSKSVIISESASTLSTRGYYEFPLPIEKTDFTNSLQMSSYDLNAPEWAEISDDDFMWQQQEPYVAGEFVWTGFDYLGEPTPYNNSWVKEHGMTDNQASRSSYFGIVDLVGIPKDRYYLYKSYWKPDDTTIHILPHWNWADRIGKKVPVFVYTNGNCAELFLNGVSQGRKCKKPNSDNSTDRFRLMWKDVIYQPGEIKVAAYKNDTKIGEKSIVTTGEPVSLKLTPDRKTINADGKDLSYVLVEAIDENGHICPLADNLLKIKIDGPGRIAGVGNGNPQSINRFQSDSLYLFYGKAMIIVASDLEKGEVQLQVTSEGLKKAKTIIKTN